MKTNAFVPIIVRLYQLFLLLYPSAYREEFGAEVTAVFTEAVTEAAAQNLVSLLSFCGRELRDYPLSLLRQYRRQAQQMEPERMATFKKRAIYLFIFILLALGWRLLAGFYWGTGDGLWLGIVTYWPFALLLIGMFAWPVIRTLAPAAGSLTQSRWLAVGLLSLASLFVPSAWMIALFSGQSVEPFGGFVGVAQSALLTLALIISAVLLHLALKKGLAEQTAVFSLILSLLLLVKGLHSLYWLLLWDSTYDSLEFFWLGLPLLGLFLIGTILFSVAAGRAKLGALFYGLAAPLLLIGLAEHTQTIDFRQLTEQNAAQISVAVEQYYEQNGRYPQNLNQLIPRTILSLPEPIIIYGQTWCYEANDDYYRLGYVDRQHWSDPRLSGHLHKAAGNLPTLPPLCQDEVAAMQDRYPDYPYEYWTANE